MTKHVQILSFCFGDPNCKILAVSICLHLPQEGVCVSMNESKKDFSFPLNNMSLESLGYIPDFQEFFLLRES